MIVDLSRGRGFPIDLYDTVEDSLSTRTRPEFDGREPEYWRPHPHNPNVLVGYVRDEYDEREWWDDPIKPVPFDHTVGLKLRHASVEPAWDQGACDRLHCMGVRFYEGLPDIVRVNELWHARQALAKWFADKQLSLFGR